jgi:hypothetical protein
MCLSLQSDMLKKNYRSEVLTQRMSKLVSLVSGYDFGFWHFLRGYDY